MVDSREENSPTTLSPVPAPVPCLSHTAVLVPGQPLPSLTQLMSLSAAPEVAVVPVPVADIVVVVVVVVVGVAVDGGCEAGSACTLMLSWKGDCV